jgi:hypothetical protein
MSTCTLVHFKIQSKNHLLTILPGLVGAQIQEQLVEVKDSNPLTFCKSQSREDLGTAIPNCAAA